MQSMKAIKRRRYDHTEEAGRNSLEKDIKYDVRQENANMDSSLFDGVNSELNRTLEKTCSLFLTGQLDLLSTSS